MQSAEWNENESQEKVEKLEKEVHMLSCVQFKQVDTLNLCIAERYPGVTPKDSH